MLEHSESANSHDSPSPTLRNSTHDVDMLRVLGLAADPDGEVTIRAYGEGDTCNGSSYPEL